MAVNLLLSYAFHAGTDLSKVRAELVCGRLMVDSGAFTAWTKGRPIDRVEYAEYLEVHRKAWDHAVTLDVIGDPAASRVNTRWLHERGLPVMPVFTRGDTLAEFDAMVRDVGYVCVGGLVGLPSAAQRKRVSVLQRRARAAGGGIHALGVGAMGALREARPYSADASSVSAAFRFGTVVYFDGREVRTTSVTDRAKLARDQRHISAHGIDLATIARTGKLPGKAERGALMQAMSLAYACADEVLKASGPVPAPRGAAADQDGTNVYFSVSSHGGEWQSVAGADQLVHQPGPHVYASVGSQDVGAGAIGSVAGLDRTLHPGPHLYNSVTPGFGVSPSSGLDAELHRRQAQPPLAWRWYGHTHQCRETARD